MISIIYPALPSNTICGLIMAQVQLLNTAVDFRLDLSEKKKSNSLYADPAI